MEYRFDETPRQLLVQEFQRALSALHHEGLIDLRSENELEVASYLTTAVEGLGR